MPKYKVTIEASAEDPPKEHEISAAFILAEYFQSNITFLRPEKDKTPDVNIGGVLWEIKSPTGNGRKTIENNLRAARKQSTNVVIDLRRSKLHQAKAISRIRAFLFRGHRLKRLVIVTKAKRIVELL